MNNDLHKSDLTIQMLDTRGERELYLNCFRLIYAVSLAAHCDPESTFPSHRDSAKINQIRFIAEDAGGLAQINSALLDDDVRILPHYFYEQNKTRLSIVD